MIIDSVGFDIDSYDDKTLGSDLEVNDTQKRCMDAFETISTKSLSQRDRHFEYHTSVISNDNKFSWLVQLTNNFFSNIF